MANDNNHHSDRITLDNTAATRALDFQPSSPETIDYALFNWVNDLCNLHAEGSKGWRKVPLIWVGAERAHQVKANKDLRDSGGMLILPLMALDRISITKDPTRKGEMPANLVAHTHGDKTANGVLTVARRIKQDKTSYFRGAAQRLKFNGDEYDGDVNPNRGGLRFYTEKQDGKIVYETISMPMPSRVLVEYKLTIQTDFHQQMNEILQGLHAKLGNHSWFRVHHENHHFDAKMEDFSYNNNLATLEEEDRTLKTEITIKVEGYFVGGGPNDAKPKITIRENAVSIVLPREAVMIDGISVPEQFVKFSSSTAIRAMRQVHASMAMTGKVQTSGGSSGGGVNSADVVLHEDYVVLQAVNGTMNATNKTFTLTSSPRSGTVTLVHNGLVQSPGASADYTISDATITMSYAPESDDRLVASYVKN